MRQVFYLEDLSIVYALHFDFFFSIIVSVIHVAALSDGLFSQRLFPRHSRAYLLVTFEVPALILSLPFKEPVVHPRNVWMTL